MSVPEPMKFPLASLPFENPCLSDSDKNELVALADLFVNQTLADYEHHLKYDRGVVDNTRWKMVKRFENVVVYQDREALRTRRLTRDESCSLDEGPPKDMQKLLWFGTILGDLDDLMYGVINPTADDAKVKAACVGNNVLEFGVLDTIVEPTADDPFRGLQIKWAVNGGPSLMRSMVRCRDFVYLESTGMTMTSTGERIGYHILHSIEVPGVPELQEHKIVRGNMTLYHLYRQKSDGVVETYVKAFIDVMGEMPASVATFVSAKGVVSVWKLGEHALMKKLVWLLNKRKAARGGFTSSQLCGVCHKDIGGPLSRKKTCRICTSCVCSRCSVPKKIFLMCPITHVVKLRTVPICTQCIRVAEATNGLDVALDELSGQAACPPYWSDENSLLDTSSRTSLTSSSAW